MGRVTVNQAEFELLKRDLVFRYATVNDPQILAMFRREVPVDTGYLRSQHRRKAIFRQGTMWVIRYVAPTGYDIFVHQGTRPRVRQTRNIIRGGRLQATIVARVHGGQRANPWLVRSFQNLGLRDVRWLGDHR